MAEKMANSIGRELRYFEYKLRKKQQTSKKKKNKNDSNPGGQMAWSDSPTTDDFKFTPTSEELQKAMPGSKGEEELQIQVALAMSREEEQERARQSESDKVRLEMAIKESVNDNKPKPQPSLLDMSLSTPKVATAPAQNLGPGNPFGGATNDPWGVAPAPVAAAPTFDPFAPQSVEPVYAVPVKSAPPQNDAWGIPQTTAVSAPPTQDPWGGAQASFNPQPAPTCAFPSSQPNDPWGGTATSTSLFDSQPTTQNAFQSAQNPFPTAQNAFPTSNDAFSTTAPSPNAFSSASSAFPTSAPTQNAFPMANSAFPTTTSSQNAFSDQNGAWGNPDPFLSTQPAKVDPFAQISSLNPAPTQADTFNMTSTSSTFTAPPFDPLKEFDSLHIGTGTQEPAPVVLQHDFSNGKSVSKDLFPLGGVLEPEPLVPAQQNGFTATPGMTTQAKKETDLFLGENSGLVNLDSGWKTYQVPYCSKPLGTVTQNPFQQTGPSKSLNELKSTPGF